jgi:hypothetical protein
MGETDEIDLGFLKIWNFDRQKNKYISDSVILAKIEKILATHVTQQGNVKGVGIVQITDGNFHPLSEKEIELVQQARAMLFLSITSANNTKIHDGNSGHSMMTSENFDVFHQNFSLDDDHFSERTGEIIQFMKAGYTLQKIRFQVPSFVPMPHRYDLDRSVLAGLHELKQAKPKVFQKIVSSTQIFMEGYYNSGHLANKARILMFMSAFEMILAIPAEQQRRHFKANIEAISNLDGETKYINYWDGKAKPKSKEILSKKGVWAEKFYLLRNKIIHGERVTHADFLFEKKQSHINIALIFFIHSVKKQLERSLKKYTCDYEIHWERYLDRISYDEPKKVTLFVYRYSTRKLFEKMKRKLSK